MDSYNELNTLSERNKRSFVTRKIKMLRPLRFKIPVQPSGCIVFTHIPKTGGTNTEDITEALTKRHVGVKSIRVRAPKIAGRSPNLITESWIGGLEHVEYDIRMNPHLYSEYNFISGHFPFGLHEHLLNSSKYIVLVRHPVERAISSTNFDYQRGDVTKEDAQNYLFSEIDNPQTRILAGKAYMTGECNDATLAKAKSNIENHFLLAGVTEDTDMFIQILASIQNWGPLGLVRNQVTGDKALLTLSPEVLERLANKHEFDISLYNWVKERWHLWKENYVGIEQEIFDTSYLCITSDFGNTHSSKLMTEQEINIYNQELADDLIEINHNRVLPKPAAESEVRGDTARRNGVYTQVHEDSSTEPTKHFASAVGFGKKSNASRIISSNYAPEFFGLKNRSGSIEVGVNSHIQGYC